MARLTPEEFEMAVKIERTEGRAGFGSLLAAAVLSNTDYEKSSIMGGLWPHSLGPHHWDAGRQIVDEYIFRCHFEIFLAAAALHADLENQRKIEQICPGLNEELNIRYNTPGSLIPGETRVMDGRMYRCVEVTDDYGEAVSRKVVEVENV